MHLIRTAVLRRTVAVLLLALPMAAPAAPANGHALLTACSAAMAEDTGAALATAPARLAAYCRGFVHGAAGIVAITEPLKPGGQLFCPGADGIDRGAAVQVVHDYLVSHPARLDASADTLVAAALAGAWPCPPTDPDFHRRMLERGQH